MQISHRVADMKESATLAVGARAAAMKAQGIDVVGFSMGEPDFDTPANIKRAAIAALEAGMTKYAPTAGDKAAREAIARKLQSENGIACTLQDVTVTAGAKHAVYMALQTMIEPGRGDEVILPTPAWVSYRPLIELAGGVCVEVAGAMANGFRATPAQVQAAMTPRTIAILLNSPSNPCGIVYPVRELKAIVDVIAANPKIAIISDEIYEKLIFPEIVAGTAHWSPGSDPRVADRTITINGMSKAFAMTGWRIGYLCAPGANGQFAKEVIKLQGQMTNSIASFFLPAVVEALAPASAAAVEEMRAAFASRAVLMHRLLSAIPGFRTTQPTGAFYSFPEISQLFGRVSPGGVEIDSAQAFADALLNEAHVAVVPGEDFGECARGHVRFSFACSPAQIEKGLARVEAFVRSLKAPASAGGCAGVTSRRL
ncbi:MAG: pyridoxal phosphate-dependent aminotransferase [Phycisphaerales bacterium]|nr:pyridoxal phosphate-dependent aminotransferase [Phycisphaerales bacterium]